jgi:hypothetical protein
MKKLLIILITAALGASCLQAEFGDRTRLRDGSGTGGMWSGMGDLEMPEDVEAAKDSILAARTILRASREALMATLEGKTREEIRAAVEEWKALPENKAQADIIRENMVIVRTWFRENRPHRPDPVYTDHMKQRRHRFSEITGLIRDLRGDLEADPENEELKAELRTLLQERKRLMRKRRGGGVGGDRRSPEG